MSIPLSALLQYKFPEIDFDPITGNVLLQDFGHGAGAVIGSWNLPDTAIPTAEDIAAWQIEYDLAYRQSIVMATRKQSYPTWEQQLDMQYNDSLHNTTTWKDAVAAVKVANPIPME